MGLLGAEFRGSFCARSNVHLIRISGVSVGQLCDLEGRAQVVNVVGGFGLSWQAAFGVITLLYFYSHYLFASGAAHIGAMYTAFLSVAIACGAFVMFLGTRGMPD